MSNYSSDTDLGLYLRETGSLPPLYELHTEAKRVIDGYLRNAKGLTSTDIGLFGTTTLADLKAASCYWVLGAHFNSFVGSPDASDAAARFFGQYQAQMSSLYIEYTGSEEQGAADVLAGGDCTLG